MADLKTYIKKNQDLINDCLTRILDEFDQDRILIRAMRHSLMAGGKRLRPILSIAAAQACGKDFRPALPVGCAIEMVHTYSLIHDDLPGMDNDDLRRGVPTCHRQFSEAVAILAGDALLTHAFTLVSDPASLFDDYPDEPVRLKLISKLARASGLHGMVEGQMLDMQSYSGSRDDALDHLKQIHAKKTGEMIIVSVESGAVSVSAPEDRIQSLVGYAEKIGLAFQVVDDILNVEGDPKILGKAVGSDRVHDKMTFPAVIGLDQSRKFANHLVADAKDCLSRFGAAAGPLIQIADYIINRDH